MNSLHAIIFFIVEVHSLHLLGLHETLRTHPFQNMFETGNIIQLKCCSSAITKELLVENFGGRLLLAEKSNPYFRINLIGADNKKDKQCGVVEFKNGSPQFNNMFELKTYGDRKYLLVLGNKCNKSDNAQSGRLFALGVDKCGNFVWRCLDPKLMFEEGTSCFQFYVKVKSGELIRNLDSKFEFQKWQLRRLVTEGYVHLPRICNNTNIDHCIAVLNNALGVPGRVVAGGVQSDGIGKLAGDLSNCEAVRSLFQGEVEAVVDALFAGAGAEKLNLSAQIAFRFPELRSRAEGGIGTDEFKSFGKFAFMFMEMAFAALVLFFMLLD